MASGAAARTTSAPVTPARIRANSALRESPPARWMRFVSRPVTRASCSTFARTAHAMPSSAERARLARADRPCVPVMCESESEPTGKAGARSLATSAPTFASIAAEPTAAVAASAVKRSSGRASSGCEQAREPREPLADRADVRLEHIAARHRVVSAAQAAFGVDHGRIEHELERRGGARDQADVAVRDRARAEQPAARVAAAERHRRAGREPELARGVRGEPADPLARRPRLREERARQPERVDQSSAFQSRRRRSNTPVQPAWE